MKRSISKSIQVNTSCEQVFQRWTQNKESILFFAPKCDIELKIGGKYEQYFIPDNEPGTQGSEGCQVLSFIPNKMFSFSWNAPPQIPEVRDHPHKTWVVILLNEVSNNQCQVDLHHLGFLEGNEWDKTIDYFEPAWSYVLNNLQASFQD